MECVIFELLPEIKQFNVEQQGQENLSNMIYQGQENLSNMIYLFKCLRITLVSWAVYSNFSISIEFFSLFSVPSGDQIDFVPSKMPLDETAFLPFLSCRLLARMASLYFRIMRLLFYQESCTWQTALVRHIYADLGSKYAFHLWLLFLCVCSYVDHI